GIRNGELLGASQRRHHRTVRTDQHRGRLRRRQSGGRHFDVGRPQVEALECRWPARAVTLPLTTLEPGDYLLNVEAKMGARVAGRALRFQVTPSELFPAIPRPTPSWPTPYPDTAGRMRLPSRPGQTDPRSP